MNTIIAEYMLMLDDCSHWGLRTPGGTLVVTVILVTDRFDAIEDSGKGRLGQPLLINLHLEGRKGLILKE